MGAAFWSMVAVVGTALFAFIAVAIWVEGRQKAQEVQYRDAMARRIGETGESRPILEYVRETERVDAERVRTKARMAGLIMIAVGTGLMVFFYQLVQGSAVYLVGLIPLLIGVVLLAFSEFGRAAEKLSALKSNKSLTRVIGALILNALGAYVGL